MNNNKGLTLVALVITIIVLLILAGVTIYMMLGNNGVLNKSKTVEIEFNKGEVLEELNIIISEKYLDAYHKATKDGKVTIEKYYNGKKVILFLLGHSGGENGDDETTFDSTKYIEELEGFTNTDQDSRYFINLDTLKRKIEKYGKGTNEENATDYFYLKTSGMESNNVDKIEVYYKTLEGADEKIGDLQIQQSL